MMLERFHALDEALAFWFLFLFLLAEYSKDLPTYLQYCKDVVFAGLELPFEDHEEEKIIEQLWEFYQNQKVNFLLENEWDTFFVYKLMDEIVCHLGVS